MTRKKLHRNVLTHNENLLLLKDLLQSLRTKFKSMYINKLGDVVNKYINTFYSTIKMKHVDIKSSTYIDFDKKNNKEGPKFKVGDNVRTLKQKNIFAKSYVRNWSEEAFVIKKVKNTVPWTYVISDVNGEEIVETFY